MWIPSESDILRLRADAAHAAALEIIQLTAERIGGRSALDEALRFGTFSLLIEAISRLGEQKDKNAKAAVELACEFQERNKALIDEPLSDEALEHFADIIVDNEWDWEDFSVAFLDPEAARIDRLRENLRRTPTERWQQHQRFMRNFRHVKRA